MPEVLVFNQYGYLPAGFHPKDIDTIKSIFVDNFPESVTRKQIFDGYIVFCEKLRSYGVNKFKQWLDGSFCTSKENPNDIDVITFIEYDELNKLTPIQQTNLNNILTRSSHDEVKSVFKCDSYFLTVPPESHPNYGNFINDKMYWRGVWGFDRSDNPKGVIEITYQ